MERLGIPGSGTIHLYALETGMTGFMVSNVESLTVTPTTEDVAEVIGTPGVELAPGD